MRSWLNINPIKDTISNIQVSSYSSDILKLAGGTAIAQALGILASPIITRMYGPEDFGLSALFGSIAGIIAAVVCLRYELAIMLPEKNEDAANLLALSLLLAVAMSSITALVVWMIGDVIVRLLNAPGMSYYISFVPISVFISGIFLALNYWNSRSKHFGRLSIARVTNFLATTSIQLGLGFSGYTTGGSLISASLFGSFASTLMLGIRILQDDAKILKGNVKWSGIKEGLKRYKRFPIYDSWAALLNTISWQLPAFLLSFFFSSKVVGYYALGMMVLQLPASLIGGAVAQVFFQRAAEAKFNGTLSKIVEDTVLRLGIIGIFPILLLSLIGKEAFTVIFGNSWTEAGVYAQYLALWIFFFFITSPISTLFGVLEMQKMSLCFNIIIFPIRGGALIIGGMLGDPRLAIILFSAAGVVIYAWSNIWLMKSAGCSITGVSSRFVKYLACCAPLLAVAVFSKWIFFVSPKYLVIIGGVTMVMYYYLVAADNKEIFR